MQLQKNAKDKNFPRNLNNQKVSTEKLHIKSLFTKHS